MLPGETGEAVPNMVPVPVIYCYVTKCPKLSIINKQPFLDSVAFRRGIIEWLIPAPDVWSPQWED